MNSGHEPAPVRRLEEGHSASDRATELKGLRDVAGVDGRKGARDVPDATSCREHDSGVSPIAYAIASTEYPTGVGPQVATQRYRESAGGEARQTRRRLSAHWPGRRLLCTKFARPKTRPDDVYDAVERKTHVPH
jgi:hypothetical protein